MFDPHHLKRKSRASKTGQIIQCKPIDPPFTFNLKTWELYYEWAKKNNLVPNPPTPIPTYNDSVVSTFDTSKTIIENIALQEDHDYQKLLLFTELQVPNISTYPLLNGNSICAYVNDKYFDTAEFLLDNQYIFTYQTGNDGNKIYVQFDIDLNYFYIDVTLRPINTYSYIPWYCNVTPGGNNEPFAISEVSPAEKIQNNSFATWHIDYSNEPTNILDQYCQIPDVQLYNPTFVDGAMTNYGTGINFYNISSKVFTCVYFY